jgi:hypothetical protein
MKHQRTRISRISKALSPFGIATLLSVLPLPASAVQAGDLGMEVLVNGTPLEEYAARGNTYIEATEGAEYAIRLSNRSGSRIAVALAVDGLNSIDAKSTDALKATKWVLGPHESITVSGWQTSQSTARRFFFTTETESYGAWLGKTLDLGVIEAVSYREREPVNFAAPGNAAPRRESGRSGKSPAHQSSPAPPAEAEGLSDDHAATGIGREVDNPVRRVRFDIDRSSANRLRIRYEYRPQLVRLGVLPAPCLPDPLERRERARGFDDIDFAPDPYRCRSRR